jgi:hypothetical protein
VRTIPQPQHYASGAERQAAYRQRVAKARADQLNAKGLPSLPAPSNVPGTPRWRSLLAQVRWALDTMESEMQAYSQARSEEWQDGEKGEAFQEKAQAVAALCAAAEELENDYFI